MRPAVKWSGSKRPVAGRIAGLFPDFPGTYYEPFIGGGSVLFALAPEKAVCGDICAPLALLWRKVRDCPEELAEAYRARWERLRDEGPPAYYAVRERFNREGSPEDLLFLTRTCAAGLIRFNRKGEFNNGLHAGRSGIRPETLRGILLEWSERIRGARFFPGDYEKTAGDAGEGDLVYLDPPYFHARGMYCGPPDRARLFAFLERLNRRGALWALSLDGSRGEEDLSVPVPEGLFRRRVLLDSPPSPFSRLAGKGKVPVRESLYLSF